MKKLCFLLIICLINLFAISALAQDKVTKKSNDGKTLQIIQLPSPQMDGDISLEKALKLRRSTRKFAQEEITLEQISQLLWAAQGITKKKNKASKYWLKKYEYQGGYRTAPSAGALFPMEVYVVVDNVKGLTQGLYKYIPKNHSLKKIMDGDKKTDVFNYGLKQKSIAKAPALILLTGVLERVAVKYKKRAQRYMYMEAGAVGQNIYLQTVSLKLGTVMIGAFKDKELKNSLNIPEEESPLLIMPVGIKQPKTKK